MTEIVDYIKQKYDPACIIVYGSYADGSNNAHSDLDALVLRESGGELHDVSVVGDIRLDVFVYPVSRFESDFDINEIIQIFDGKIILDRDGIAERLIGKARAYIENIPAKTPEELSEEAEWCEKMLLRAKRGDAEGLFRLHWLLTESLEIFCDIVRRPYLGPKKSLKFMRENHAKAFSVYSAALESSSVSALENWIGFLKGMIERT